MIFSRYTTDTNGYVCNGVDTYRQTTLDLIERGHVALNWTDQDGTVLNIVLVHSPTRIGTPGGVVDSGPSKLWVGVAGHGCYAFAVNAGYLHGDYVGEKLGVRGTTAFAVANLISQTRSMLAATDRDWVTQ